MSQPQQPPANHTDAPQSRRAAGGKEYTLLPQDSGIAIDGWRLERHKGPISNSAELDEFQDETSIHCPEMPFLSNHLTLRHAASGIVMRLDPRQALRMCAHDKNATVAEPSRHAQPHAAGAAPGRALGGGAGVAGQGVHPGVAGRHPGAAAAGAGVRPGVAPGSGASAAAAAAAAPSRVQVSAASKWTAKSYEGLVEGGVKQVNFNFDWTYTTVYKGDVLEAASNEASGADSSAAASPAVLRPASGARVQPTSSEIRVELLTRPDPILWYDTIPLFEDELHDNGIASLTVRVRVMENCFLVLLQFFLRVDEQLVRVYDTRIFHEFGTDYCIREQTRREDTFDALAKRGMPRTPSLYTDPMVVSRKLTLQATEREKISLAPRAAE